MSDGRISDAARVVIWMVGTTFAGIATGAFIALVCVTTGMVP